VRRDKPVNDRMDGRRVHIARSGDGEGSCKISGGLNGAFFVRVAVGVLTAMGILIPSTIKYIERPWLALLAFVVIVLGGLYLYDELSGDDLYSQIRGCVLLGLVTGVAVSATMIGLYSKTRAVEFMVAILDMVASF